MVWYLYVSMRVPHDFREWPDPSFCDVRRIWKGLAACAHEGRSDSRDYAELSTNTLNRSRNPLLGGHPVLHQFTIYQYPERGHPVLELRTTNEFPHQGPIASLPSGPRSEITAQRPLPIRRRGQDALAPWKGNRDYCATSIGLAARMSHAIEKVLSSTIGIHGNLYSHRKKTAKSTGHRRPYRRQQVKEYGYRLRFHAVVS